MAQQRGTSTVDAVKEPHSVSLKVLRYFIFADDETWNCSANITLDFLVLPSLYSIRCLFLRHRPRPPNPRAPFRRQLRPSRIPQRRTTLSYSPPSSHFLQPLGLPMLARYSLVRYVRITKYYRAPTLQKQSLMCASRPK
jgi:hypothetical protein